MIKRDFEVPWEERALSKKQARQQGLFLLKEIADAFDYSFRTVDDWQREHNDFPEAKAHLDIVGRGGNKKERRLYSGTEVANWFQAAKSQGRITKTRKAHRSRHTA